MNRLVHRLAGALCAALLAGCVVYFPPRPRPRPRPDPSARADMLLATERGMRSLVFDAHHGYLSLSNTASAPSLVLRTGAVVNRASAWLPLELEECALGPARGGQPLRAPALARLEGKIYLFQPTFGSAKDVTGARCWAAWKAMPAPIARSGSSASAC